MLSHAIDKVDKYLIDVKTTNASVFLNTNGGGNNGSTLGMLPLEGQSLLAFYAYKSGPLTYETGDPQGYLNGKLSTDYASILAATTVDSLMYVGPSRPTNFGALRNSFTYKGFELSINILYKFNYFFKNSFQAELIFFLQIMLIDGNNQEMNYILMCLPWIFLHLMITVICFIAVPQLYTIEWTIFEFRILKSLIH